MSVWKDYPELESCILELIEDGTFRKGGEEEVKRVLTQEFPNLVPQLSLRSVRSKLAYIVWSNRLNRERLEQLATQALVNGADVAALFPLVPGEWIRSRLQRAERRGREAGSVQRVGGLVVSPEELRLGLQLPPTSLQNPFPIKTKDSRSASIMAISAPQVGLIYRKELGRSALRNALFLAEEKACDAVLMVGNLIHLDLRRASRNTPYRAELSGMTVEPEVLVRMGGYDSTEEIEKLLEEDGLVFSSLRERFETLLKGLRKLFTDDGRPIFSGGILITFGLNEEELIHYATHEELRAQVAIGRQRLQWQIQTLNKELRKERRAKPNSTRVKELEEAIEKRIIRLKKTNMTNVSDEAKRKMRDRLGAWVIERLTEVIPNSEVVGIDEVFLSANGKTIQIVQNPTNRTADTYLGHLIERVRKETRSLDLADLVLLGGRTVLTRTGAPVRYYSQTRGSVTSDIEQLPMLLDREFLVEVGNRMVKKGSPLLKLLADPHFYTGVNIYQWVDGVPRKEYYSSKFLSRRANFAPAALNALVKGENMIYGYREGDPHEGHPWVVLYPKGSWPHWVTHDEACLTLLERLAAPILWYMNLGDINQGHHFETELENHPDWMRPYELLDYLEALRKTRGRAKKIEGKILYDKVRAGIIRPDDQLLNYIERFFVPRHAPFAARMIIRARRAGFTVRGNLGVATILSGNHFMNTAGGQMTESTLIRAIFVPEMEAYALRNGLPLTRQEIEDAIKAPMLGKIALAEGVFGIKQGKRITLPYAVSTRHKPVGRAAKYADPIRRAREAYGKRGATNQESVGLWTLVMHGHTHMGGSSSTPYGDFLGCGSQTNSDPFGESQSYPLNIISSVVTGVHVDGADRGPRVEIPLRDDLMRAYVEEPWEIDAKKLFANAIGWDEE